MIMQLTEQTESNEIKLNKTFFFFKLFKFSFV